jgi:MFS transporter, OFA family, oxalate/formate antiporter
VTTRYSSALDAHRPEEAAMVHPADAKALGVGTGDTVQVTSRRGSVKTKVAVTDKVQTGMIWMSFHYRETPTNELTVNAFDPVSKTGEYKVAAVQIEKYIGYGVIGGIGNGLAYVVPIATLIRWFPDRRGLIMGLSVMGFGLGAFFIGKIVPGLINNMGVINSFFVLGAIYLIVNTMAALTLRNPPAGWLPDGFTPSAKTVSAADSFSWEEAKKTPQWYMIWGMLFLNVSAGMGLISKLSPMAQEVISAAQGITDPAQLAIAGGGVLATASIFNGLGRLFWSAVSDKIGRKNVFLIMFATQAALYFYLPMVTSVLVFTIIACYLLACLGGGFAVMPSFAADSFGPTYIGKVYGFVLTAWGAAGVAGGYAFKMFDKQQSLYIAAGLLIAGFAVTLMFQRPKHVSHYKAAQPAPIAE